jgi:hypothetical protein
MKLRVLGPSTISPVGISNFLENSPSSRNSWKKVASFIFILTWPFSNTMRWEYKMAFGFLIGDVKVIFTS